MKTNMHVARVHEWNVFQVPTGKHNDNTSVANPKTKVFTGWIMMITHATKTK